MTTIWKFSIPVTDSFELDMPEVQRFLSVQTQAGSPCLWVVVNTASPRRRRKFQVRGTGHSFDGSEGDFLGTFQLHDGALVFHLFVTP